MMGPVVSCLMPISPRHRNALVHRARKLFHAQTYKQKQLVEIRMDDVPLGALRNMLARQAIGDVLCAWDSDDWYHPRRLEVQVEALREADVTGAGEAYFLDDAADKAWRWGWPTQSADYPWYALGATLAYRRSLWDRHQFEPYQTQGEDTLWLATMPQEARRVHSLPLGYVVCGRHDGNATVQDYRGIQWSEADPAEVRRVMAL